MNIQTSDPTSRKPLRLRPAIVIVIVQWLLYLGIPVVAPDAAAFGMLAAVAGGLLILLWWLFFSRAPWLERVGAVILMIVAVAVTKLLSHVSIAGAGMGNFIYIMPIPWLTLALVVWAVATRHLTVGVRRGLLVAAILIACAPWLLIRTGGTVAGGGSDYHWRWTPTAEERLLAQGRDEPLAPARVEPQPAPSSAAPPEAPKEPAPTSSR